MPVRAASNLRRGDAVIVIDATFSPERWVTGSKPRISSITSPKKSRRYGWVAVIGYTSMIPPRTA